MNSSRDWGFLRPRWADARGRNSDSSTKTAGARLARAHRVVIHDSLRYGWSRPTTESRDIDLIVDELHVALARHGEAPPYLFVAHSAGTLEAIRFAELYPNEVVGLVSLDGGSPEYYSQKELSISPLESLAYSGLRAVGIARLASTHWGVINRHLVAQNGRRDVPPDVRDTYRVLAIANLGSAAIRAEANQGRIELAVQLTSANSVDP